MTPEEAPDGRRAMEFTQTSGPPMETLAHGCICSYTWADGKPCRNGPMESCQALHPEDVTVTIDGGEPVPGEWGQVQYAPGLEERVAALEALLTPAITITPGPEWTDEQTEKFKADFERRMAEGSFEHRKYEPIRWLPPGPVLTREVVEAALRECVTVVKPGETLVIRCRDWTPDQAEQWQEYVDATWRDLPFRVVVVIGDELAVAPAEPDDALAKRVEEVLPGVLEKELRTARTLARSAPSRATRRTT